MSCYQTLMDYGLRSIGYGERLLPKSDITLCEQFVLIGSGMIWNIYFAFLALLFGFLFSTVLALGKNSSHMIFNKPSRIFILYLEASDLLAVIATNLSISPDHFIASFNVAMVSSVYE